jgi:RNA polymerase sigma factor (sigma-70 family)
MSRGYVSPLTASFDSAGDARDDEAAAIRDEVSALFETHAQGLTRYLRCRYGDEHAEELAQETFLRMYDVRVKGIRIDNPTAWLIAVSSRIAISWWRKAGRDRRGLRDFEVVLDELSLTASPEAIWLDQERMTAVRIAENRLTAIDRTCLSLRARGQTLEEIGQQVQMNFRRVAEIVSGAIRKLNAAQE